MGTKAEVHSRSWVAPKPNAVDAYAAWVDIFANAVLDNGDAVETVLAVAASTRYLQTGEKGDYEFHGVFRDAHGRHDQVALAAMDLSATRPEHVRSLVRFALSFNCEDDHFFSDRVMETALKAIADGAPDPAGIAREAFVIATTSFTRWYA